MACITTYTRLSKHMNFHVKGHCLFQPFQLHTFCLGKPELKYYIRAEPPKWIRVGKMSSEAWFFFKRWLDSIFSHTAPHTALVPYNIDTANQEITRECGPPGILMRSCQFVRFFTCAIFKTCFLVEQHTAAALCDKQDALLSHRIRGWKT